MKTIKTTHIDTGGHGYYSVSKKDIIMLGIDPAKITGYSGHTLNRVYLEEDCDASLLFDVAKEKGYVIVTKNGYNLKFNIHHNYMPELFNWKPEVGKKIFVDKDSYTIDEVDEKRMIVSGERGRYKIKLSNPFQYITGAEV